MTKAYKPTEMSKGQSDNTNNVTKKSITQRLRTDLGQSVGVTTATKLSMRNIGLFLIDLISKSPESEVLSDMNKKTQTNRVILLHALELFTFEIHVTICALYNNTLLNMKH